MDKGTDCLAILMGQVIPLKLGWIAVINRSQKDIKENKSIKGALQTEKEYFIRHPSYRKLCDRLGIPYLSKTMNKLLMHHIKNRIPSLKQEIHFNIINLNDELNQYGKNNIEGIEDQGIELLKCLSKFSNNFSDTIQGTGQDDQNFNHSNIELYGGARIVNIFHVVFRSELELIGPFKGLSDYNIRTAIRNACGARLTLFVPDRAFEILVRKQISKLRGPCLSCVERVFEELQRVALFCEPSNTKRFRHLNERINETINEMMRRFLDPTINFINNVIDIELAYINIKHEDFMSGGEAAVKAYTEAIHYKVNSKSLLNLSKSKEELKKGKKERDIIRLEKCFKSEPMNSREITEINIIKNLLKSYFKIVKKNVGDMIPKVIMHLLVNKIKETIQSELVSNLYKEEMFESLLSENPEIAQKRRQCKELISILKNAICIIKEVRDYKI